MTLKTTTPNPRAFPWTGLLALLLVGTSVSGANSITLIPTLGGMNFMSTDLNSAGQVVGFSTVQNNSTQHVFLFSGGTMHDLGTLGGTSAAAWRINDAGQIAGESATPGNAATHAFLYENGVMNDLGTLSGSFSSVNDLNPSGVVVGYSAVLGNVSSHAFRYSGGTMQDLGTLGGAASAAIAVNASGHVVGDAQLPNGFSHPFLYATDSMIDLGTLGGNFGIAWDINDDGVVAGEADTANGETHAFVHVGGVMMDLGTLGGTYSMANVVNNAGVAMGNSMIADDLDSHAFIYAGGMLIDLGTLGGTYSFANHMNASGQVVGESSDVVGSFLPFLWDGGVMLDVNELLPENSGWQVFAALRINDAGQILGYGLHQGNFAYYLLTLVSDNQPPVADAGADQSLACPGQVGLDGSGSSDPDGDALSHVWTRNGVMLASGSNPVVTLGPGTHTLILEVTDPAGASDQDSVVVSIADTVPPVVTCPISRTVNADANCTALVPDLTASVLASDNCTGSTALIRTQSPAAGTAVGVGNHTVTVTVTDGSGNSASCSTALVVADVTAPVITQCASPATAPAGDQNLAAMPDFLAGVLATDNCSGAGLTGLQTPAPGTSMTLGQHAVTLTVSDSSGNTATCETTFTVVDGTAPTFTCPAGSSVEADADGLASIPNVLGNLGASDNVTPSEQLALAQSPAAGVRVGAGTHTVLITVSDAAGNVASCETTVTVTEPEPPCALTVHGASASPQALWPANGKMVLVQATVSAESTCGEVVCEIVKVTDNETNDSADWNVVGPLAVELRAERHSKSGDRVYRVTVRCRDAAGNQAEVDVEVTVPRKKPSDDGSGGAETTADKPGNGNGNGKGNAQLKVDSKQLKLARKATARELRLTRLAALFCTLQQAKANGWAAL